MSCYYCASSVDADLTPLLLSDPVTEIVGDKNVTGDTPGLHIQYPRRRATSELLFHVCNVSLKKAVA